MSGRYYPRHEGRRPSSDSVDVIECENPWCGELGVGVSVPVVVRAPVRLSHQGQERGFCSLGCASRWAIRTELALTRPAAVVAPPANLPPPAPVPVMRAWGRLNGFPDIGGKGRLPHGLVEKYRAAHP